MARKKPAKAKPQPAFHLPAAAIALNSGRRQTTDSRPGTPVGPRTALRSQEDCIRANARRDGSRRARGDDHGMSPGLSRAKGDTRARSPQAPREDEETVGRIFGRQGVPPDLTFHKTTFVDNGRLFIQMLLKVTKGSKANGLVAYGTLSQWCATLIQLIGRHCVDDNGDRSGAKVLQSGLAGSKAGGLFRLIIAEAIALFREFRLDKRIPSKARMGRYEAQRIVEEALRGNTCKEAAITVSLSVAIATRAVTALRPGALGYSHPEWDGQEGRIGKDLQIRRDVDRGEGAFLVTVIAEHIKASPASVGRNGTQAFKPLEFMLRSLQEPQNIPFDPVNYIITLLYHRVELLDYVGKPYEDVLKGTEFHLRIGNADLPLFVFPLSTGDLYGEDVAAMLMAHQDKETTARIHYLHGVAAYDWSGIAFGEIKSGNQEHAQARPRPESISTTRHTPCDARAYGEVG
ncbi:hypothetical protein FRC04_009332 [Tulasnella sp. 424]|nr:hypothetical protein FRC04_009332 [Tulasnella sp. 424]